MLKTLRIFVVLLSGFYLYGLSTTAIAGPSYNLPADLSSSPFNCTGSGPSYSCGSNISISKESDINLSANVTLNISGNLGIAKELEVNANGFALNFNVDGNVTIDKEVEFVGNISATGNITLKKEGEFTGNITAGGNINIEKDSTFVGDINAGGNISLDEDSDYTGDVTSSGNLNIDGSTTVNGSCTPTNAQCTGSGGGGGGSNCGINPIITAGFGGTEIDIDDDASNNGSNMTNGTYTGNASLGIGATTPTTGLSVTLPGIEPSTLPANGSSTDDTLSNNETINATTDVFYDEVEVINSRTANLTGGGPFHIRKLKIEDDGTLNIAAGTYYIDELEIKDSGTLNITSEPVRFYIGDKVEVDSDNGVTGSTVAGFQVLMLDGSDDVKLEGNSSFTGMIYAPYGAKIELKDDAVVNAQLVTTGELKIKDDAALTFSAADSTAVSSISTCQTSTVPTLLSEWRFDESSWDGTSSEVVDELSVTNGTSFNGANTSNSSPAKTGNPGTCSYGSFDGSNDYVDLNGMGNLTGSFTITAWIYADTTNSGSRILIDDQNNSNGYGFSLGDPGNGKLRFYSRAVNPISVDTANVVISSGQWYHVAAVHNASSKTRQIFVDGAAVALDSGSAISTYTGTWGTDSGAASIGGENNASAEGNSNFRFNGNIDEVRVYNGVLSAAEIAAVMAETHTCPVSAVDHFVIDVGVGPVTASTCNDFSFTVTAEDSSNNPVTDYSGTVSLTTSTAHGNFKTVTAENTISDSDDNGSATYLFDDLDDGEVTLAVENNHAETLTITVVDSAIPVSTSSIDVTFSDNVFEITDNEPVVMPDNVPVAGRPHSYHIEMIRNDSVTGSCGPAPGYDGTKSLKMWRVKNVSDPSLLEPSFAGTALKDNSAGALSNDILFTAGEADVDLITSDIGQYQIHLADESLSFAGTIIPGNSIEQTVRPFGLALTNITNGAITNPGTNVPGGAVFQTAGANFSVTVEAVLWDTNDDNNTAGGDGIIDAGRSYNDNTKVPSYAWDTDLIALPSGFEPSTGSVGNLLRGLALVPPVSLLQAEFVSNAGTVIAGDIHYSEVGSFTMRADATDFLSASGVDITSDEIVVGRFIPNSFQLSNIVDGSLENSCVTFNYIGQPFGYATPPGFRVTALNVHGNPTTNYFGTWNKLLPSSFSSGPVTLDTTNSLDIEHSAATPRVIALTDNSDGSFDTTFAADSFCYGINSAGVCQKQANSMLTPFTADIDLTLATVSDGEVTTNVNQAFSPAGNDQRFGRVAMKNEFGSEIVDITLPMQAEYFDGVTFILNSDDISCSAINTSNLTITNPGGLLSTVSVDNEFASSGVFNVLLTAPGTGNDGAITVMPELNPDPLLVDDKWLQFDWDGNGLHDNNPTGTATFGIFKGDSRQIYYRQIYR